MKCCSWVWDCHTCCPAPISWTCVRYCSPAAAQQQQKERMLATELKHIETSFINLMMLVSPPSCSPYHPDARCCAFNSSCVSFLDTANMSVRYHVCQLVCRGCHSFGCAMHLSGFKLYSQMGRCQLSTGCLCQPCRRPTQVLRSVTSAVHLTAAVTRLQHTSLPDLTRLPAPLQPGLHCCCCQSALAGSASSSEGLQGQDMIAVLKANPPTHRLQPVQLLLQATLCWLSWTLVLAWLRKDL